MAARHLARLAARARAAPSGSRGAAARALAERRDDGASLARLRFPYPEFLPDPDPTRRSRLREELERRDMIDRRRNVDLPEFYVGSVLAVVASDPHARGNANRFVGICIERKRRGLLSEFTLRNTIDKQGVEVRYNLYDPTIKSVQVLRLEKRLDDDLRYLRDALPEYSTFDFDLEAEFHPEGAPVPLNPLQVVMKPKPWDVRWQIRDIKGIKDLEKWTRIKDKKWIEDFSLRRIEKYDTMKQYRTAIPEEEQNEIWSGVYSKLHELEIQRRKTSRKKQFAFPQKKG